MQGNDREIIIKLCRCTVHELIGNLCGKVNVTTAFQNGVLQHLEQACLTEKLTIVQGCFDQCIAVQQQEAVLVERDFAGFIAGVPDNTKWHPRTIKIACLAGRSVAHNR